MDTTTPLAIHERFVAVIQATVPVYEYLGDVPWAYVEELPGEVSGLQIRRFTMDYTIAEPSPEGLFSDGEEYEFLLEINVSYGGLPKLHAPFLIQQDAVDLRTVLEAQLSPTAIGLLSVRRIAFSPISDETGLWFGTHVFEIHYLHDTMLTLIPAI